MANTLRDEVNLRLYCCRLQLQQYEQLLIAADLPVSVIRHLAGEAACLHLQRCYQAYLLELGQAYNVDAAGCGSAGSLASSMAEQGVSAAEISQFCELESDTNSWLSALLAAVGPVSAPTAAVPKSSAQIRLMALEPSMLDLEALQTAYESLSELIESQRSLSQEW